MVNMPLYEFRMYGTLLRAIVSAYKFFAAEYALCFKPDGISCTVMDLHHISLMDLSLRPSHYKWYTADETWVLGRIEIMYNALRRYKKGEEVNCEIRDDGSFWVGGLRVGTVTPAEEVGIGTYKAPLPKIVFPGGFTVVTESFARICKAALAQRATRIGILVHYPETTFLFFNERVSREDARYKDYFLNCRGDAESIFELDPFTQLLFPELSVSLACSVGDEQPILLEYSNAEYKINIVRAPLVDTKERLKKVLEEPKVERKLCFTMDAKLTKVFSSSLKAILHLGASPLFLAPLEDWGLYLYWKMNSNRGYVRFEKARFERFYAPTRRLSVEFNLEELTRFMRDVETLELYTEEAEETTSFVLVGRGPKIAERELKLEAGLGIEVPDVRGVSVFQGSNKLLLRTVEDAKVSEDEFVVFYTTPRYIVAFGQNRVYYEATLALDSFRIVEENQVPVVSGYRGSFDALITFFRNIPTAISTIGKENSNVYVKTTNYGIEVQFSLYQDPEDVKRAMKAYHERIKLKPPVVAPPPKVPPAKTPEQEFKEVLSKVSAVNLDYEEVALKFRSEEEKFYKVEKKPTLGEVKALISRFTEIEPKLDPLKTRYEPLKTQLLELYKTAKIDLMREIDRVVGGEITPNLKNIDFFKGRVIYLLPQLRRMEKELEVAPAKPPVAAKLPKIPEEGITDEWLFEVAKISPEVKPEVMTTTEYKYEVFLNKWVQEVKDSLPMGIMPLNNPVEVEEFLKLGKFDLWTWRPEDITYLGDYAKFREIWSKTYSRSDLEPLLRKDVDEIARVKHLSWSGTKEEVINRILGVELPPAPPAVPPVARPPPPKKIEVGLGYYEEKQLRDRFYARLSRAGVRVTPEIRAEYREKYADLEKRFREVDREEALKKAGEEIDVLADDIIKRPRVRPPVVPAVPKPPVVPYDLCPVHNVKMERVNKLPLKVVRGRVEVPSEVEVPYLIEVIRKPPPAPPPEMMLLNVPETLEIYYCAEGNHFFLRTDMRSEERSLAYLLRTVERETARIQRIAGIPVGRTLFEQLQIEARELERNPRFGDFLRSSGFRPEEYPLLDELSKRALRESFRLYLRGLGEM